MMNHDLQQALSQVFVDTYSLYLKTQSYHWHVRGPYFKELHLLFEEQYNQLALAVDQIAERIVTLGGTVPANFADFVRLKSLSDANPKLSANDMLGELYSDHNKLVKDLYATLRICQEMGDEGGVALFSERIVQHEKTRWMLGASREV